MSSENAPNDCSVKQIPQTEDLERTEDQDGTGYLEKTEDGFTPIEGGWGWLVCVTSMWTNGCTFGILNVFGIMYVVLREKYKDAETDISFKTSLVGSLAIGINMFMSLPASIAMDKIGLRKTAFLGSLLSIVSLIASAFVENISWYYLTFGIMYGTGMSFTHIPALTILGHYFKKRLSFVFGIATLGSSIFSVGLSLCLPPLLNNVGLRWTFMTLAGMCCVTLFCTLTWKTQYISGMETSTGKKSKCKWISNYINFEIWKNRKYVIWLLSLCVYKFGYFTPFVHLPKYSSDKFPEYDSSMIALCLSASAGVGKLVFGKIGDCECTNILILQQCGIGLYGLATVLIPLATDFWILMTLTTVIGLCDGLIISFLGSIVFKILGHKNAAQGIGTSLCMIAIPITVGPALVGLMYDEFKTYTIGFHIIGCSGLIAFIILCFLHQKSCKNSYNV